MSSLPSVLRALPLVIFTALGACAPPPPVQPWQKAGTGEQAVAADTAQCQALSQQQATRLYPYGASAPTLGGAGMIAAQQQSSIDRDSAQLQMFNECMEGKGYTRSAGR